ncbi:MAG: hypothetical protein R3E31_30515 [Chloroflexota bacterium]
MLYNPVTAVPNQQNWGNRALTNETARSGRPVRTVLRHLDCGRRTRRRHQAVRSTWNIDQARANWLAVDDREYLTRRK